MVLLTSKMVPVLVSQKMLLQLPNLPIHQILVPVIFFLLTSMKNNLYRRRHEPQSALGSAIVQCLQGVPKKSTYLDSETRN